MNCFSINHWCVYTELPQSYVTRKMSSVASGTNLEPLIDEHELTQAEESEVFNVDLHENS